MSLLIPSSSFSVKTRSRLQTLLQDTMHPGGGGASSGDGAGGAGPDRERGGRMRDGSLEDKEVVKQRVLANLNGLSGVRLRKLLVPCMWLKVWRKRRVRAQQEARNNAQAIEESGGRSGSNLAASTSAPASPKKRSAPPPPTSPVASSPIRGPQPSSPNRAAAMTASTTIARGVSYRLLMCQTLLNASFAMKAIGEELLRQRCTGADGIDEGAVLDIINPGQILMHAYEPVQATGVVVLLSGTLAVSTSCREAVGRGPEPGEQPSEVTYLQGPAALFPDRCFTDALLPYFVVSRSLCEIAYLSYSSMLTLLDRLSTKQRDKVQSCVVRERMYSFRQNFPQTVTMMRCSSWLVQGLSDNAVEQIMSRLQPVSFFPNTEIYAAKSPTSSALFLRRGKVELTMLLTEEQLASTPAHHHHHHHHQHQHSGRPGEETTGDDTAADDSDGDNNNVPCHEHSGIGSSSRRRSQIDFEDSHLVSKASVLGSPLLSKETSTVAFAANNKNKTVSFDDDGDNTNTTPPPTTKDDQQHADFASSSNMVLPSSPSSNNLLRRSPPGGGGGSPQQVPQQPKRKKLERRTYVFEAPLSLGELGLVLGERRLISVRALTFVDGWELPEGGLSHFLVHERSASHKIMSTAIKTREQWLESHQDTTFLQNALRRYVPGLHDQSSELIDDIMDELEPCVIPARTPVAALSNTCDSLFLIVRGKISEQRRRKYGGKPVRFGPGHVIGECCALRHKWPVQMCATTRVDAWRIAAGSFSLILRKHGILEPILQDCEIRLRELCDAHGVDEPPFRDLKANWNTVLEDLNPPDPTDEDYIDSDDDDDSSEEETLQRLSFAGWTWSKSKGVPMETHKFEPDVNFGIAAQTEIKTLIKSLSETPTARQRCIMRALDALGLVARCDLTRIRTPLAVRRRRRFEEAAREREEQRRAEGGGGGASSSTDLFGQTVRDDDDNAATGSRRGGGVGDEVNPLDDPKVHKQKALGFAAALLGNTTGVDGNDDDDEGNGTVSGEVPYIPKYHMMCFLPCLALVISTAEKIGSTAPNMFALLQRPARFEGVMEGSDPGPYDVLLEIDSDDDESYDMPENAMGFSSPTVGGTGTVTAADTFVSPTAVTGSSLPPIDTTRGGGGGSGGGFSGADSSSASPASTPASPVMSGQHQPFTSSFASSVGDGGGTGGPSSFRKNRSAAKRAKKGVDAFGKSRSSILSPASPGGGGDGFVEATEAELAAELPSSFFSSRTKKPQYDYKPKRPHTYLAQLAPSALQAEERRRVLHAAHDKKLKAEEEALQAAREKAVRLLRVGQSPWGGGGGAGDDDDTSGGGGRRRGGGGGGDSNIKTPTSSTLKTPKTTTTTTFNKKDTTSNNVTSPIDMSGGDRELFNALLAERDLVEEIAQDAPSELIDAAIREEDQRQRNPAAAAAAVSTESKINGTQAGGVSTTAFIDHEIERLAPKPPTTAKSTAPSTGTTSAGGGGGMASSGSGFFSRGGGGRDRSGSLSDGLFPPSSGSQQRAQQRQQQQQHQHPGSGGNNGQTMANSSSHRPHHHHRYRSSAMEVHIAEINEILPEELHDHNWEARRLRLINNIAQHEHDTRPKLPQFKIVHKKWKYKSKHQQQQEQQRRQHEKQKQHQQQRGLSTTSLLGDSTDGRLSQSQGGESTSNQPSGAYYCSTSDSKSSPRNSPPLAEDDDGTTDAATLLRRRKKLPQYMQPVTKNTARGSGANARQQNQQQQEHEQHAHTAREVRGAGLGTGSESKLILPSMNEYETRKPGTRKWMIGM